MTPDRDLIDALCRNIVGHPASVLDWGELVRVRYEIDRLFAAEIDRRQAGRDDPRRCAS